MLPSETMIWQPEFTDKTLSRKPGAVQPALLYESGDKLRATKSVWSVILFISDFVIHDPNFSTPAFAVNEALMTKAIINFLITLSPWI
ncbi:hypothetical protein JZL84_20695, partial [Escherichia coli]|uniref:hypothetical protein n=1 Tax=Escherichia coli TaxID=562 RepID=UPI0019CFDE61